MRKFRTCDIVKLMADVGNLKKDDEFVIIRVGLQNYVALDAGANECDLPADKVALVLAGSDFSGCHRDA